MKGAYTTVHAGCYDTLYAGRPYRAEVDFVMRRIHELIRTDKPRVAEIACGTGTHAFLLENSGCEVTALDVSADMLQEARRKAEANGSRVRFLQQDMRTLKLEPDGFEAAVSFFDSIGYAVTPEGVARVLEGINKGVVMGGVLILEFWHGPVMLRNFEPLRVKRLRTPDGELLRISQTQIDPVQEVATVNYTLFELRDDGSYARSEEQHINRFFSLAEMDALLRAGGFQAVGWHDGFRESAPVTSETWHVVAVARKVSNSPG
jgi:SAM-dependent methyltransferase